MFRRDNRDEDAALQKEIDHVLSDMSTVATLTPEYKAMVDHLTKLYALKEDKSKRRVSADTMAVVAGNLVGIVLIVGHERAHVVTSKALNFVMKAR